MSASLPQLKTHSRGQLSVGLTPTARPLVARYVRKLDTCPAFAQAESTSTLEPPFGTSEACVEENDQHVTRDAAAAMHRHSVLFRELRRHVVWVHITGFGTGAETSREAFFLFWGTLRPFILTVDSRSAALKL